MIATVTPICGDYEDGIWYGKNLKKANFDEITDESLEYVEENCLYYVRRTGDACELKIIINENELRDLSFTKKSQNLKLTIKEFNAILEAIQKGEIDIGNSPSLERRNIINKEIIMSQEQNNGERTYRPSLNAAEEVAKNQAFINMRSQRKVVLNAIQNGSLSCLPGPDGFADTQPALNITNGNYYHGANLLYLKDHQKKNGFPTAEYLTEYQIEKAAAEKPELKLKKEEKGVFLHWEEKNEQTGDWEKKSTLVYNVAQVPGIKEYITEKKQEEFQKYIEKKQIDYPGWEPKEPKQTKPGPVIECSSAEPEKYLGQYLAAISLGGKFKVTPEQSAEFSKNMEKALTEIQENGYPDISKLSKISNAANQYSIDVKREVRMLEQKEEYKLNKTQEQTLEQTQGMKR